MSYYSLQIVIVWRVETSVRHLQGADLISALFAAASLVDYYDMWVSGCLLAFSFLVMDHSNQSLDRGSFD